MREVAMSSIRQEALKKLQQGGSFSTLREAKVAIEEGTYINRWQEAMQKSPDGGFNAHSVDEAIRLAEDNALLKRVMQEAVLSDMAQALGVMHDTIIQAVSSMAVARDIIWNFPTDKVLVRFYARARGKRWSMRDGPKLVTPGRHSPIDLNIDQEWGTDALFSKSYIEDTPYAVIEQEVAESGQLLEEGLTTDVLTALETGRTTSNEVASAGDVIAWADVVDAWTKMKGFGRRPKVMVCSPTAIGDLWKDDKFIHSFYFGDLVDVARGVLGTTYLGFKVVETDLKTTAGTGATADDPILLDTDVAAALAIRRDTLTEPYKEKLSEGVISTMRYGIKALDLVNGLTWIDRTG